MDKPALSLIGLRATRTGSGGEVERALTELSRIENKRTLAMVMGASPLVARPFLSGEQLRTSISRGTNQAYPSLSYAEVATPIISELTTRANDNDSYAVCDFVFQPGRAQQ